MRLWGAASILKPSLARNLVCDWQTYLPLPRKTVVMKRSKAGFTLIELVIVIVIGSILTGVALSSFQTAQNKFRVRGAKSAYVTMHQRARSRAVEMGETVLFVVNTVGDSVWSLSMGGGVTDIRRFRTELNVDLQGPSYFLCMTPRGYADYSCGSFGQLGFTQTFNDTTRLQFWLNADSTSVLVLPMGQLVGAL